MVTSPNKTQTPSGSMRERFRLDGRVAVITGASRGIGEAIGHALADYGARVVLSSRSQEGVDAVAASIRDAGGEASARAANAGDPADLQGLVDHATERWGGIDIVVCNAATNPVYGPVVRTDADAFSKIMQVNVQGPFELCKRAYGSMRERGGGSIITLSSIGGLSPEPGLGIYSVSKAALISLTGVLAREWGPDGIRANTICPGLIRTRFSRALWENEQVTERMLGELPLGRIGVPEDVAGLALFLASDAAAYCTGAVYTADGGYTI